MIVEGPVKAGKRRREVSPVSNPDSIHFPSLILPRRSVSDSRSRSGVKNARDGAAVLAPSGLARVRLAKVVTRRKSGVRMPTGRRRERGKGVKVR